MERRPTIIWHDNDGQPTARRTDAKKWEDCISKAVDNDPAVRVVIVDDPEARLPWVSGATRNAPGEPEQDIKPQILQALKACGLAVSEQ